MSKVTTRSNRARVEFAMRYPEEFEYFAEYARRFDNNPSEQRYGILPYGADPKEENMICAEDPRALRDKHVDYIMDHPEVLIGTISDFRRFLTWLERLEGKI